MVIWHWHWNKGTYIRKNCYTVAWLYDIRPPGTVLHSTDRPKDYHISWKDKLFFAEKVPSLSHGHQNASFVHGQGRTAKTQPPCYDELEDERSQEITNNGIFDATKNEPMDSVAAWSPQSHDSWVDSISAPGHLAMIATSIEYTVVEDKLTEDKAFEASPRGAVSFVIASQPHVGDMSSQPHVVTLQVHCEVVVIVICWETRDKDEYQDEMNRDTLRWCHYCFAALKCNSQNSYLVLFSFVAASSLASSCVSFLFSCCRPSSHLFFLFVCCCVVFFSFLLLLCRLFFFSFVVASSFFSFCLLLCRPFFLFVCFCVVLFFFSFLNVHSQVFFHHTKVQ